MRELRIIADTILELSTRNISIDWDVLRLEHISGSYGYKLIINRFGDSLALELVYQGQRDTLFTESISWMQGRLKNDSYQQRFSHADILLLEIIN